MRLQMLQVPDDLVADDAEAAWLLELPAQKRVSLNDRDHWAVKQRKGKPWRDAAAWSARVAKVPPCERIRVTMVWAPKTKRNRDADNAMPTHKAVVDGLVAAGVVPDDHVQFVESRGAVILPGDGTPDRWWVLIERMSADVDPARYVAGLLEAIAV